MLFEVGNCGLFKNGVNVEKMLIWSYYAYIMILDNRSAYWGSSTDV